MLILGRRPGERIVIADNIVVAVLGVCGDRVQIGVEAPREIRVRREELRCFDAKRVKSNGARR